MASFSLHGISVSRGIAIGRAHLLAPAALDVKHYLVSDEQLEAEVARLQQAIALVERELHLIREELPADAPTELGAFLDVHILILSDPLLVDVSQTIIRSRHYNAEWALATQIEELASQFEEIEDPYLRERKNDIQQVGERILKVLTGNATPLARIQEIGVAAANMIVVAHDISPADMLQFRDHAFGGFITDLGGQTSHTAIVARSLGIPAVVGMPNASTVINHDDWVIVDGNAGVVVVDPSPHILEQYRKRKVELQRQRKKLNRLKKTPAVTRDGTAISLLANIEFPEDCALAVEAGAVGVGLFRTEFLFMGRAGNLPTEEEQYTAYRQTVVAMKGRPVTIRSLDLGADKPLDVDEETALNPALGLRAIRYCLSEPLLFLAQLRAILRASAHGPVKLLIPMLAHAFEVNQTLQLVNQAKEQLRVAGQAFDPAMPIGAMIEIPAAALALPLFTSRLDFLSIGTNDLIQYALAIDRVDHEVAHLYDPLHPAILYLLSHTIAAGARAGLPVSVCGEMAGEVQWTRLLLGMGLREFSMHPVQVPAVKQEVLHSDLGLLTRHTRKLLRSTEPEQIANALERLQQL